MQAKLPGRSAGREGSHGSKALLWARKNRVVSGLSGCTQPAVERMPSAQGQDSLGRNERLEGRRLDQGVFFYVTTAAGAEYIALAFCATLSSSG